MTLNPIRFFTVAILSLFLNSTMVQAFSVDTEDYAYYLSSNGNLECLYKAKKSSGKDTGLTEFKRATPVHQYYVDSSVLFNSENDTWNRFRGYFILAPNAADLRFNLINDETVRTDQETALVYESMQHVPDASRFGRTTGKITSREASYLEAAYLKHQDKKLGACSSTIPVTSGIGIEDNIRAQKVNGAKEKPLLVPTGASDQTFPSSGRKTIKGN